MCPTPNCDGAGFTFDIFPTDPDHPANEGWCDFDESSEEEESEFDDDDDVEDIEFDAFEDEEDEEFEYIPEAETEWNPEELEFKSLDEIFDPEDLEGEEWKYGLEPGERPKVQAPPPGVEPQSWAKKSSLRRARSPSARAGLERAKATIPVSQMRTFRFEMSPQRAG